MLSRKKALSRAKQVRLQMYDSLCGDRLWVVRGTDRMLVEITKYTTIKDIGLAFYGLPVEIYTDRSDYRHGEILIRGQELSKALQHSDNKKIAKKLENNFINII